MKKGIEVRVAAVVVRDGKVLLVRHEKKGESYWVLPGGHVEPGETLTRALTREMAEELQLDVTVGPLMYVHDFIGKKRHIVNNVFGAECASADFSVTPQGALREARFFSPDQMTAIDLRPPIADELRRAIDDPAKTTVYLGCL